MLEVFRLFSSISNHSRLQPVEQVAHYRQSVVSIRHSSKSVTGDSLRSFGWLIFLDKLVAGLLVAAHVLCHRRLAWEIVRTVFADSFALIFAMTDRSKGMTVASAGLCANSRHLAMDR